MIKKGKLMGFVDYIGDISGFLLIMLMVMTTRLYLFTMGIYSFSIIIPLLFFIVILTSIIQKYS